MRESMRIFVSAKIQSWRFLRISVALALVSSLGFALSGCNGKLALNLLGIRVYDTVVVPSSQCTKAREVNPDPYTKMVSCNPSGDDVRFVEQALNVCVQGAKYRVPGPLFVLNSDNEFVGFSPCTSEERRYAKRLLREPITPEMASLFIDDWANP